MIYVNAETFSKICQRPTRKLRESTSADNLPPAADALETFLSVLEQEKLWVYIIY